MNLNNTLKSQASQNLVPIKEIMDGVLIMEDGSLRMLLMASSLNFSLKSDDEQEAIISQYQNFLNSLDFSVQFCIQSRDLDIEPYLQTLREREKAKTNELLKIQTREYIGFVKELVSSIQIVTKSFYIVVPYTPSMMEQSSNNPVAKFLNSILKKGGQTTHMAQEKFEEYKIQLMQRAETVIQGLARTGVRSVPLNTEELIELFHDLYNPDDTESGPLPQLQSQIQAQTQ